MTVRTPLAPIAIDTYGFRIRNHPTGTTLPLAQIHAPQGALTLEQRHGIIKGATEVIASIEKLPPNTPPYITVLINGVSDGAWSVPGL